VGRIELEKARDTDLHETVTPEPNRLRPSRVRSVFWNKAAEMNVAAIHQESDMADASLAQTISADAVKPHALAKMKPAKPRTCCGGPPPTDADACCARDAEVKSTGGPGCGCGSVPATPAGRQTACCGHARQTDPH